MARFVSVALYIVGFGSIVITILAWIVSTDQDNQDVIPPMSGLEVLWFCSSGFACVAFGCVVDLLRQILGQITAQSK